MSDLRMIRLMIVTTQKLAGAGVTTTLDGHPDLLLVVDAPSFRRANEASDRSKPEAILFELIMPELDGVNVIQSIVTTNTNVRIQALTSFMENEILETSMEAGAAGFLLRNITAADLIEAIMAAHINKPALAPEAVKARTQDATFPPELGNDLTPRERDVLDHLVEGLTNAKIAHRLHVSPSTVKHHVSNIMRKLGAVNRTKAATLAIRHNLVGRSP